MRYLLLLLFGAFSSYNQQPETVNLKVVVTNIKTLQGSIELGIFNDQKNFLRKGYELKYYSQEVTKDTVIFHLNDFKRDTYAITVYQDVNSDGKCNIYFIGIPKEPYGFSKNFRPKLLKPSFNDCKVDANEDTSISIELIH